MNLIDSIYKGKPINLSLTFVKV